LAHHRDLHPFPTRRSSDLAHGTTASAAPGAPDGQFHDQRMPGTDGELSDATGAPRPEASIAPPPGDPNAPVPGPEGVPPGPDVRSEEHTSELQSREKLVCR